MTDVNRFIREPERFHLTGVPRGTWYELEKDGKAPKSYKLSSNTKGYLLSEIQSWIDERIEQSAA